MTFMLCLLSQTSTSIAFGQYVYALFVLQIPSSKSTTSSFSVWNCLYGKINNCYATSWKVESTKCFAGLFSFSVAFMIFCVPILLSFLPWPPHFLIVTCRQTWCMSCYGHQQSKLFHFSIIRCYMISLFHSWPPPLFAVPLLLRCPCGLGILILLKSLSQSSAENAELFAKVCDILWGFFFFHNKLFSASNMIGYWLFTELFSGCLNID